MYDLGGGTNGGVSGGGTSSFCFFGYISEGSIGSIYGRDFRLSRTTIPRSKAGRDSSNP